MPEKSKPFQELNITSINLAGTALNTIENGNRIIEYGSFTMDGQQSFMADVEFAIDSINQLDQPAGTTADINIETLFLPFSRGYGNLKSLHASMTENTTLLTMMKEFVANDNRLLKHAA